MKATSFLWDESAFAGAWARLSQVFPFNPSRRDAKPRKTAARLLDRLDHWFWRQAQRDREAYLAGARDVYELEDRIRRLERSSGSRLVA